MGVDKLTIARNFRQVLMKWFGSIKQLNISNKYNTQYKNMHDEIPYRTATPNKNHKSKVP